MGLTNYIIRIQIGNHEKELQWRLRVRFRAEGVGFMAPGLEDSKEAGGAVLGFLQQKGVPKENSEGFRYTLNPTILKFCFWIFVQKASVSLAL